MLRIKIRNELHLKCLLQDDDTCWQVFHANLQKPWVCLVLQAWLWLTFLCLDYQFQKEGLWKWRYYEAFWVLLGEVMGNHVFALERQHSLHIPIVCIYKCTHVHGGIYMVWCECRDMFIMIPSCIISAWVVTPRESRVWVQHCTWTEWCTVGERQTMAAWPRRCCSLRSLKHI